MAKARPAQGSRAQAEDRLARRERADDAGASRFTPPTFTVPAEQAPPPPAAPPAPARTVPPAATAQAEAGAEAPVARERRAARPLDGRGSELAPGALAATAAPEPEVATAEDEEEDATSLVDDSATERDEAGRPPAVPTMPAPAGQARPGTDERFRSLSTRAARNAAEARALRDAWQALVREDPAGPHADDARMHALEAGAAAWRLGRLREDRAQVERDARDYLRRTEGAHKERVRALLAGLEP
jgi:hypothetical protein